MLAKAHWMDPLPTKNPPRPEKELMIGANASALKTPVGACVSTV